MPLKVQLDNFQAAKNDTEGVQFEQKVRFTKFGRISPPQNHLANDARSLLGFAFPTRPYPIPSASNSSVMRLRWVEDAQIGIFSPKIEEKMV